MSRYTHAQRMKLPPFYDYSRARFFARARKDRDDAAFVVLDDELQARGLSAEALPRATSPNSTHESSRRATLMSGCSEARKRQR